MYSSAWVSVSAQDAVGLQDIMLEEKLHLKETKKVQKSSVTNKVEKCSIGEEIVTPVNGEEDSLLYEEIPRLLQQQFNEECKASKNYQNSFNKTVNIPILCSGNKADQHNLDMQAESEDEENNEDFRDHKDWDQSDMAIKEINKHDVIFYNERGAEIVKSKSDKVDNGLKLQWKLYETDLGLDEYNSKQLHKMIKNQTLIHKVNYVINKGQDAVLLHAECNKSPFPNTFQSKECVIKVFTLKGTEFKKRASFSPQTIFYRRNINILAETEMLILIRLKKAGILCPEVLALENNMLIMSFIGQDHHCALPLKFTNLTVNEYISAYRQVVEAMKSLFNIARLIHTDLSECSILWHNKRCYFIEVSQVVDLSTEAFSFLFEDCKNISKFFTSMSLPDIMTAEELFMEITGCDYHNKIEWNDLVCKLSIIEPGLQRTDDVNIHDTTIKQEMKFAEHNT